MCGWRVGVLYVYFYYVFLRMLVANGVKVVSCTKHLICNNT